MSKPTVLKVNVSAKELMRQRSFVQAVRTGGITSAARVLGLTPSAVSKNIMRLEAELGTQLLSRDNRHIAPTQRGAEAFEAWSALLMQLDQVHEALSTAGVPAGELAFSIPSGAIAWLAPLFALFRAAYPEVQLRLHVSDGNSELVRDRNDIALRLGRLKDSGERAVSLGSTPLVVCAAPGYLARAGFPQAPAELAAHEGIGFRLQDSGRLRPIELAGIGEAWHMPVSVDNGEALVQAAVAGMGLIQAPLMLLEAHILAGSLVEVLPACRPAPLEINLVFQANRWLPASTRALIDIARSWANARTR